MDRRAAPLDAGWGSAHLAAGWREEGGQCGRVGVRGDAQGGGLRLPQQCLEQPHSLGAASSTAAEMVVPVGKVCWQEGGAAAASPRGAEITVGAGEPGRWLAGELSCQPLGKCSTLPRLVFFNLAFL